MKLSKKAVNLGTLSISAQKNLEAEILHFEAAMYRKDQKGMQEHREKAQAILDSILDLKAEQFRTVCNDNGLEI